MKQGIIINIGREYGSGGHNIGEKLSKELDIPFYDRELIIRASKESGITEELFKVIDEQKTQSFLYSLATGAFNLAGRISAAGTVSMADRLFLVQSEIINKVASEGSCVIVGRCADYILREKYNCVNIFIHASIDYRIERISKEYNLSEFKAKDTITKIDKNRANYYNYYTNEKWSNVQNYHLSIDSSTLGEDGAVELIKEYIKLKEKFDS